MTAANSAANRAKSAAQSQEQRSAIAANAARARWDATPKAQPKPKRVRVKQSASNDFPVRAFRYRLKGAQRCCLESLYRAQDIGALETDLIAAVACNECSHAWHRDNGWWHIEGSAAPGKRGMKQLRTLKQMARRANA